MRGVTLFLDFGDATVSCSRCLPEGSPMEHFTCCTWTFLLRGSPGMRVSIFYLFLSMIPPISSVFYTDYRPPIGYLSTIT